MSVEKPSRARRLLRFLAFRVVPVLLIAGIVLVGVQIAQSVARYLGEQSNAQSRQPLYVQTATAIANAESTPDANEAAVAPVRFSKPFSPIEQDSPFVTNTPPAPVEPTLAPTLEVSLTPRPLPTLFPYGGEGAAEAGGTAVPTAVQAVDRQGYDLLNIVLLGHDGELTDDGFIRTDTMIIVSINRTAGTVAMLSLPRDLYVYIPGWTMQRLNLAYIHGEAVGWTNGGFGLLRQTLFYNLGINVHYYAMVNLSGFRDIVDAVGGVDLAVDCAIENLPLIGADVPSAAYRSTEEGDYVLPVGYYHLSGGEALWYARSRDNTSDFDRGARQQQILQAIWRKARDTGLLNNAVQLWNEGSQYVETNLALEDIIGLVPLALSIDPTRIESFSLVRTYHTTPWQTPQGDYVQLPNYEPIRQLLVDFYTPPTESQIVFEGARIRVLNGTGNADWDRVAAETLARDGFNAFAAGSADRGDYSDTTLVDYTGRTKGSSLEQIARLLNVNPQNIQLQPDANREYDFDVILGNSYNSCRRQGVLPVSG